jgi:hypothetical protein
MPKLWINALDNYAKNNGFKNRAVAIRSLFYPAFLEELKLLNPNVNIEPIVERKKIIKKPSVPKNGLLHKAGNVNRHKTFSSFSNFIIERKDTRQTHEKYIEPEPVRDLGYRKPRRKKEWKVSVPRRAMERSSIIHRRPLR